MNSPLLIWILDADISFSVGLKQKIRDIIKKPRTKLKIEIFHGVTDFLEQAELVAKKKKSQPNLVFLDSHLGEETTLELVASPELMAIKDKFIFCSSMSFGLFEKYFEDQEVEIPLFMQKQRLDLELEKALRNCLDDATKPKLRGKPRQQLNDSRLKAMLEKQRDLYYEGGLAGKTIKEFLSNLGPIASLAKTLGQASIAEQALALAGFMHSKPPPGAMRLKREIKEFLSLAEKTLETLE
jgi:hypothetical protein